MRIVESCLIPYRLPLRQPWCSARGCFDHRNGWLVRLKTHDGRCGYGDCAPLPEAGTESPEAALAQLCASLSSLCSTTPLEVLRRLPPPHLFSTPAARCALETALLDLLAQQANMPLAHWLNAGAPLSVTVNQTIGALDEVAAARARQAVDAGFSVLKLKIGLNEPEFELAQLCVLSEALPSGVRLRLDANGAWGPAQARQIINGLSDLPVESLEEPLQHPDKALLRQLQALAPFPLALDESLARATLKNTWDEPAVRRLVLKPMALGGVLPAMALARRVQRAGRECVVTTTVDSAAGVLAATHLAAALANELAHGVATSSWLLADTGEAPVVKSGRLDLDGCKPGLGFCPAMDAGLPPSHKWA